MNRYLSKPARLILGCVSIAIATLILSACGSQATSDAATITEVTAEREIIPIVGDLYRARNNNHYTVFLVTPEGIILGDPINLEFAHWLKDELKQRFDEEVKYVLYSHHHYDHASGGAAFADTAEFVGHENMAAALRAPLPGNQMTVDRNGDNKVSRDEAGGGTAANFDRQDRNGDGYITGEEFFGDIVPPTIIYTDTYPVYLNGREVTMIHAGTNHSDDGSILMFPEEAAVFGVDWLNVKRLPGGLAGTSLDSWIDSVDRAIDLNPSKILPGHGDMGNRDDLLAYKQYFVDLKEAAANAVAEGQTREAFVDSIEMPAYSDWTRYDTHMKRNAAEAYDLVE